MSVDRSAFQRVREGFADAFIEESPVPGDVAKPPPPGEEVAGPPLFDLVKELRHAQEVGRQLLEESNKLLQRRTIVRRGNGQTDASGNVDIPLFVVPMGFEFVVTRVNVESPAFTPAVPYSAATAWIALILGDRFGVGAILDFLPNPPLASGPILPCLFTDGADQAGVLRGGEQVSIHLANGPVNSAIVCRLQGYTLAV